MYAFIDGIVGTPALGMHYGAKNQNPPLTPPGQLLPVVDNWWGFGEVMYGRAAGTIREFGLCVITPTWDSTANQYRFDVTEAPNTANLGRQLCVSMEAMASGDYGYFLCSGIAPVNSSAAVAAAAAIGIVAAGQAGANSAGKQILSASSLGGSATTVVKQGANGPIGGTILQVGNSDGWFPGAYLSGTGIAAGTKVVSTDPSGRNVTLSAAMTATVNGAVTATYNNATIFYNLVHLNRPFLQGAIT